MLKEEIPGHKKEFPVTEENGSRKKEIYLKGNTIIIGEIFLSQEFFVVTTIKLCCQEQISFDRSKCIVIESKQAYQLATKFGNSGTGTKYKGWFSLSISCIQW